jgi:hypothetical protein
MRPRLQMSPMESGQGEMLEAARPAWVRSPTAFPASRLGGQQRRPRPSQCPTQVTDIVADVRIPTMLWLAMVAHDLRNEVQAAVLAKDLLNFLVADPRGREVATILKHQLRRIGELARAPGDDRAI